MVLGPPPVEDAPVLSPSRGRRLGVAALASLGATAALVLGGVLGSTPGGAGEAGRPGAPVPAMTGMVWGRLSAEEESPHAVFTPLGGIEVVAYPLTPGLLPELERIRDTARDSTRQHETAVSRLRETLRASTGRPGTAGEPVDTTPRGAPSGAATSGRPLDGGPGADRSAGTGATPRRTTDPHGVFAFDDLPVGDWLLVAIRVTPYATRKADALSARQRGSRESRFAGSSAPTSIQQGEVWLAPVRVGPQDRVRVFWTDRSRFMVGPVAGGAS
jgi:hypothetical protein